MADKMLAYVLSEADWLVIFTGLSAYFLLLYFGLGNAFASACKVLASRGFLEQIRSEKPDSRQIRFEIRHSLVSILNFAVSGLLVVYLLRSGVLALRPDSVITVVCGSGLLILWNELHFYVVHRVMHLPFFMRHVHWVHHRSKVPNVYSVYSFHFFESLLLSTVQVTLLYFISLSPLTITLFPAISLLLNLAGHCNYRVRPGLLPAWLQFATRHNQHHHKNSAAYGFATPVLDFLFNPKSRQK